MQVSISPNFRSINSNATNPNLIFCNSNYLPPLKFKTLGFSATVSPVVKLISSFPNSNSFNSTRRRRFAHFTAAAAAKGKTSSDYYSVLNISRNSTLQEIKAAYRSLARKYHPDKGLGSEEKFKEIAAAYEVLSDTEKRSVYDRFGEEGLRGEFEAPSAGPQGVDPFEIFAEYFGEHSSFSGSGEPDGFSFNFRGKGSKNLDIRYHLYLSLKESVFGKKHNVEVTCLETCDDCGGTGAKSGSCIKTCTECGGRGGKTKTQRTPFGIVSQVTSCSKCDGDGKIITDWCRRCSGDGQVKTKRSIEVDVPPGVDDGATMQVRGQGSVDKMRGIAGDLYLILHVEQRQGIQRDGLNLYSNVDVDITEAILGTIKKVDTVEGKKDLRIPPGTQPGQKLRLRYMGVPNINKPSVRGDHYFTVDVKIPKRISDAERALIEKLASLRNIEGYTVRDNMDRTSTDRSKSGRHLWKSIKDFLWRKQSGERFASICIDTSSSWTYKMPLPNLPATIAISIIFLSAAITLLMSKSGRSKFQQQRKKIKHDSLLPER